MDEVRLINKDAILEKAIAVRRYDAVLGGVCEYHYVNVDDVANAPTITPESLGYKKEVHGRWIPVPRGEWKCSKCLGLRKRTSSFCPNCAATMDGMEGE